MKAHPILVMFCIAFVGISSVIAAPGSMSGNYYGDDDYGSLSGSGGPLLILILSTIAMRIFLKITDKYSAWREDWLTSGVFAVVVWVAYLISPWLLVAAIVAIFYIRSTNKTPNE